MVGITAPPTRAAPADPPERRAAAAIMGRAWLMAARAPRREGRERAGRMDALPESEVPSAPAARAASASIRAPEVGAVGAAASSAAVAERPATTAWRAAQAAVEDRPRSRPLPRTPSVVWIRGASRRSRSPTRPRSARRRSTARPPWRRSARRRSIEHDPMTLRRQSLIGGSWHRWVAVLVGAGPVQAETASFNFTGAEQTFTVPVGVARVHCRGDRGPRGRPSDRRRAAWPVLVGRPGRIPRTRSSTSRSAATAAFSPAHAGCRRASTAAATAVEETGAHSV